MIQTLLGKKLNQSQEFTEDGKRIPVTYIMAGPCTVVQLKNKAHDGYWAVQLGFDSRTTKKIGKPLSGHFKKTGQGNFLPRFLREVAISEDESSLTPGDQIKIEEVFKVGDSVRVTAVSKSKGFQGGVKRHGFKGGPRTHGQSDRERAPGSIGQTTTPGRVYKGKRMAGRMGGKKVTVSGLTIVGIDPDQNIVRVKGLIPGGKDMPVLIQKV